MPRALLPALALVLSLLAIPPGSAAPASEADPDCEAGQWWIGYRTTRPVMDAYTALGAPGGLRPCEGEHWDGQDPIESDASSCSGSVQSDPAATTIGVCQPADPNAARGDDPLSPGGARVSVDPNGAVYVGANAALVARAALYADGSSLALYYRDNTPGNFVVTAANSWRITYYASESDCDQAAYHESAKNPGYVCGRDNTAITLEHGLLP